MGALINASLIIALKLRKIYQLGDILTTMTCPLETFITQSSVRTVTYPQSQES